MNADGANVAGPNRALREWTVGDLIDGIGDKTPAPGGGAVAATVGALAAALGRMVVSFSAGKKRLTEHEPMYEDVGGELRRAAALLVALADEDAEAFARFQELQKRPEDDPDRVHGLKPAAMAAATAPLSVLATCADLLRTLERLVGASNVWLRSDLAIAAQLALAAAAAAKWNVAVNIPTLEQLGLAEGVMEGAETTLATARPIAERIEAACVRGW